MRVSGLIRMKTSAVEAPEPEHKGLTVNCQLSWVVGVTWQQRHLVNSDTRLSCRSRAPGETLQYAAVRRTDQPHWSVAMGSKHNVTIKVVLV